MKIFWSILGYFQVHQGHPEVSIYELYVYNQYYF